MHRNVTAIYRTFATADLVRQELQRLPEMSGHVHVITDQDDPIGPDGVRTERGFSDQLHDLHLPDDDVRTYQHSVRQGDYVVSAEVDENQVAQAQNIMRRPEEEAYNLDMRSEDFRDGEFDPYSDPNAPPKNEDWIGRRDTTQNDPFTRTYERNSRLEKRRP